MSMGVGASNYKGEIGSKLTTVKPAVDFGIRFFLNDRVAANGSVVYAALTGNDSYIGKNRGYSFNTHLGEIGGNLEVYLFKEGNKFLQFDSYRGKKSVFNIYTSVGFGMMMFKPQAFSNNVVADFSEEYYENSTYIIKLGLGSRVNFNKHWSMSIDIKKRLTVTDYLDDNDNNWRDKDVYLIATAAIIYKIDKSSRR